MLAMSTQRDTFVAFVDALSTRLDDPDMTGQDLAELVHVSRFHFDRLVSAAAGESPGRFRRRILLERAAFRLVSSDRGVLDIAIEAGFASHEAFTRAFQPGLRFDAVAVSSRTGPSAPRQSRAASHFHPPGSLRLPARTRGDLDGPATEDGRPPCLARRRNGRPCRRAQRRSTRHLDQSLRGQRRRHDDDEHRSFRASSGRWTCG